LAGHHENKFSNAIFYKTIYLSEKYLAKPYLWMNTSVMPASWMTEEQLNFLNGELPGFRAAQHQQREPQFLMGPAECWFEKWPEHDALFFSTEDAPAMALMLDDDKKVTVAVGKQKQVR
jgi:hypothetical protein